MRAVAALLLVLAGAAGVLEQKQLTDRKLLDQLAHLFPPGTVFSPKEGTPPHFSAYVADSASGRQTLTGFAFWTTEIEPLERGYDGPIKILVGMDTRGILTGVLVVEHREPYGDFSIDPPQFAAQFKGKSIRDPFAVGGSPRRATHYVLKANIGGIAGLIAPLVGKQPPDSHVWVLEGEAPAFVKSEAPLYLGGPLMITELASPTWRQPRR